MSEQVIKFKVNKDNGKTEYTAHINAVRNGMTRVYCVEDGVEEDIPYETDEVMQYFEDGTWVKV